MFRMLVTIVAVCLLGFGCSDPTGVDETESAVPTKPESPALADTSQAMQALEEVIDEEASPETQKERKKVGKGDLSKPLDDRIEEVLPAKIRRNPDGDPTRLHLRGYGVSQSDLAEIGSYATLTELQVGWNDLDDADLHYFSRLENLKLLGIRHNPQITGATFDQLTTLPSLEELYLGECSLQPKFLKVLSESPSLKLLGIRSYFLDQSWIEALCSINTLEEVHINDIEITQDQINALEQCIPGLIVETHKPQIQQAQ